MATPDAFCATDRTPQPTACPAAHPHIKKPKQGKQRGDPWGPARVTRGWGCATRQSPHLLSEPAVSALSYSSPSLRPGRAPPQPSKRRRSSCMWTLDLIGSPLASQEPSTAPPLPASKNGAWLSGEAALRSPARCSAETAKWLGAPSLLSPLSRPWPSTFLLECAALTHCSARLLISPRTPQA